MRHRRIRRRRRRIIRRGRRGRFYKAYGMKNPYKANLQIPISRLFRTTLSISSFGQLSAASASFQQYEIKGNSVNTPFARSAATLPFNVAIIPAVSLCPAGYHNFMNPGAGTRLYEYVRVMASKIVFELYPTNGGDEGVLCIVPSYDTQTYVSAQTASQAPYAKSKMCIVNSTAGSCKIKHYMTTSKLYGVSKNVKYEVEFGAGVNADPTNLWNWQIIYQTADGLTLGGAAVWRATVWYYLQFETGASAFLADT